MEEPSAPREAGRYREDGTEFETLFETASLGIVIADEQGEITLVNARAEEMFGYNRHELIGKRIETLLPERVRQVHVAHRADYGNDPRVRSMGHDMDLSAQRKDSTEFPVEVGLSYMRTGNGLLVMSFITDISARKAAEAALRQYARRLETMQEIDRAILAAQSAEEVATVAQRHLHQLMPSLQSVALLFGEKAHRATPGRRGLNGFSPDTDSGVRNVQRRTPLAAQLDVPLVSQGESIGVLQLTTEEPRGFTDEQVEIAHEVANLLAIAMQQAQLREDLERHAEELEARVAERTQELERRRDVAEVLRDILATLNSDRPLAEVLDYIVALAGRLLGTDASALYHVQNGADTLTVGAARGLATDYTSRVRIPFGQGTIGRAASQREPVAVSDMLLHLSDYKLLDPEQRTLLTELARDYRARLAVPLTVKGEVYGSLGLYYAEPRHFSEEEKALAVAFGDQAALAIENARLRSQVEQSAVAAERSRLARDLHDAVTQTLFAASLIAEVLPRLWQRNPSEGAKRLEELRQLTRGALAEMRTLLFELRPAVLVQTELGELVHQLGQALTGRARIPVSVVVEGQQKLPPDVQLGLYRIVQEALNNVAKHAGATEASIMLQYDLEDERPCITLKVSDNGRGFAAAAVAPQRLGMEIMRERATAIGADLSIESQAGRGTQVTVRWQERGKL